MTGAEEKVTPLLCRQWSDSLLLPQEIRSGLYSPSPINYELQKFWSLDLEALQHRESLIYREPSIAFLPNKNVDVRPLNNVTFHKYQKKTSGRPRLLPAKTRSSFPVAMVGNQTVGLPQYCIYNHFIILRWLNYWQVLYYWAQVLIWALSTSAFYLYSL